MDKDKIQEALDFLNEDCEIIGLPYKQDMEYLFEIKKESVELLQELIDEHFK